MQTREMMKWVRRLGWLGVWGLGRVRRRLRRVCCPGSRREGVAIGLCFGVYWEWRRPNIDAVGLAVFVCIIELLQQHLRCQEPARHLVVRGGSPLVAAAGHLRRWKPSAKRGERGGRVQQEASRCTVAVAVGGVWVWRRAMGATKGSVGGRLILDRGVEVLSGRLDSLRARPCEDDPASTSRNTRNVQRTAEHASVICRAITRTRRRSTAARTRQGRATGGLRRGPEAVSWRGHEGFADDPVSSRFGAWPTSIAGQSRCACVAVPADHERGSCECVRMRARAGARGGARAIEMRRQSAIAMPYASTPCDAMRFHASPLPALARCRDRRARAPVRHLAAGGERLCAPSCLLPVACRLFLFQTALGRAPHGVLRCAESLSSRRLRSRLRRLFAARSSVSRHGARRVLLARLQPGERRSPSHGRGQGWAGARRGGSHGRYRGSGTGIEGGSAGARARGGQARA